MVRPADWSALKPSASSAASLVILFQLDLGLALFDSIRYTPENQHGTWNSRTIEKENSTWTKPPVTLGSKSSFSRVLVFFSRSPNLKMSFWSCWLASRMGLWYMRPTASSFAWGDFGLSRVVTGVQRENLQRGGSPRQLQNCTDWRFTWTNSLAYPYMSKMTAIKTHVYIIHIYICVCVCLCVPVLYILIYFWHYTCIYILLAHNSTMPPRHSVLTGRYMAPECFWRVFGTAHGDTWIQRGYPLGLILLMVQNSCTPW